MNALQMRTSWLMTVQPNICNGLVFEIAKNIPEDDIAEQSLFSPIFCIKMFIES